ncbi:MAG: 50S ribosomal protein L4 [Candidatus Krumholzibacteriota bacterium]|nr:50S ribosomal protein L4 [Candidatus Krumholzibacteriota bacterium]
MASAKLYDFSGDLKGSVDLPAALFEGAVNRPVLYDVVKMYLANRRLGSAKTKQRGEVSYSNRKPYRQKGTGRARAGRRSSPIWRGGGVVFGPQPRDYGRRIPRKVKRVALKSALTDKVHGESVVVVEGVAFEEAKTKRFAEFLKAAGLYGRKVLFVTGGFDENVFKSVRNIEGVRFMLSRNMNAYEILKADVLLFTDEGLSSLEEVFAS